MKPYKDYPNLILFRSFKIIFVKIGLISVLEKKLPKNFRSSKEMYQFYLFEEIAIFSDGSHFSDGGWCSLILFLKADHLRMNPTQFGLNWLKKLKIFDFQIIFWGQNQFYFT